MRRRGLTAHTNMLAACLAVLLAGTGLACHENNDRVLEDTSTRGPDVRDSEDASPPSRDTKEEVRDTGPDGQPSDTDSQGDEPSDAGDGLDGDRGDSETGGGPTCVRPGIGTDAGRFVDPKTLAYRYGPDDSKEVRFEFDRRVSAGSLSEIDDYLSSGDDILIMVEGGHYQFSEQTVRTLTRYHESQTVGIVAKPGADVRWSPPSGMTSQWMRFNTKKVVLDGIDFDFETPTNVAPVVKLTPISAFVVADCEVIGRAWHRNKDDGNAGIVMHVESSDGLGILRNYDNPRVSGKQTGGGDGRWALRAGPKNFGTLELIDIVVKEATGYGLYGSGSNGRINIRGSVVANNAGFNVRVPNGSTVVDSYFYHDWSRYTGPEQRSAVAVGTGIFVETKYVDYIEGRTGVDGKPVRIENSRVELSSWPAGFRSAVLTNSNHGEVEIIDTDVVVESDDAKAGIWSAPPDGSTIWTDPDPSSEFHHEPKGSARTFLDRTRVVGDAEIPGVFVEDREDSSVENSVVSGFDVGVRSTGERLTVRKTDIEATTPTDGSIDWQSEGPQGSVGANICVDGL